MRSYYIEKINLELNKFLLFVWKLSLEGVPANLLLSLSLKSMLSRI
jgi:hypothetical protein